MRIGHEWIGLQKLGDGSFADVWKAKNKRTGETAAVKVMRLATEHEDNTWVAVRECCILQNLHHPNIVTLIGLETEDLNLCLIYEEAETDMREWLGQLTSRLTPSQVQHMMLQITDAVAYLQSKSLIHRDLKPENILKFPNDVFKISDFGLATIQSRLSRVYSPDTGTIWYRAPEVLLGKPQHTIAIDIWALGCLFVELYTLRPAFPSNNTVIDQWNVISNKLGAPTETEFRSIAVEGCALGDGKSHRSGESDIVKDLTRRAMDPTAIHLLQMTLRYDPAQRILAKDMLLHNYFKSCHSECRFQTRQR